MRSTAVPNTRAQPALGYATGPGDARALEAGCRRLGLELIAVVREAGLIDDGARPVLDAVLARVASGEAACLVVSRLDGLADGVAELAPVLDRIERDGIRLVALDIGLDTAGEAGRVALARRATRKVPWVVEHEDAPAEQPPPQRAPVQEPMAEPEPVVEPPAPTPPTPVATIAIGYASAPEGDDDAGQGLAAQREGIEARCAALGLELDELVGDREPKDGKAHDRPGLSHALRRIAAGDASCLVIAGLERLSRSVAELGQLVRWLDEHQVRLIAIDLDLDTATEGGRTTVRALVSVGDWERERLSERTRKGLAAARAKRHDGTGGHEWEALRKRIVAMRADGMTLQAIADRLNEDGVPTQRGGAKWRPSSVQTAAGYKRRPRSRTADSLASAAPDVPAPDDPAQS